MIKIDGVTLIDGAGYNSDLTLTDGTNIDKFKAGDSLTTGQTVLADGDVNNRLIKVSGTDYSVGNTVSVVKSATGIVESVSGTDIVLSESNDGWLSGFYVSTDPKTAVTSTAYLEFDSTGLIDCYSVNPVVPRTMDLNQDIVLTFPVEFCETGASPDVELADLGAYLTTQIKLTNEYGESEVVTSNALIPETTGTYIAPGSAGYASGGLLLMAANFKTLDQRIADHTASERNDRYNELQSKVSQLTGN